jgi:hypothetical protein
MICAVFAAVCVACVNVALSITGTCAPAPPAWSSAATAIAETIGLFAIAVLLALFRYFVGDAATTTAFVSALCCAPMNVAALALKVRPIDNRLAPLVMLMPRWFMSFAVTVAN